jgi:phosphoesterase RecJ-like protein
MAVATDTGWFRHPNATPPTFALSAELVAAGANPTDLYERLYESSSLARYRLLGVALERLQVRANGRIAFTEIYLSDYPATGALITYPRAVEGTDVALVFIEQIGGGTKVSFRSRAMDVSKVAERFGGGGHKLASGARTDDPLPKTRDEVLAAIEAELTA